MPERPTTQQHLARTETPRLIQTAAEVAGFDLGKGTEFASAANVSGVRNQTFTFSQRRDSRTMFGLDGRYGPFGEAGAWRGADREVVAACRGVLEAAGVPPEEVAGIDVLSEYGAAGELVDGEVRAEEPELLRKIGSARRQLDGLSVWSSYAKVGLTDQASPGWIEVHWPAVGPEITTEGHVLESLVERGFEAPEMEGARPQSMQAGILHSAAVGFFMDVVAAVRVVYEPDDPEMGRLATLYLDRSGERVALPRDLKVVRPEGGERTTPG